MGYCRDWSRYSFSNSVSLIRLVAPGGVGGKNPILLFVAQLAVLFVAHKVKWAED